MKPYLTSIITALSIACSGPAQRQTDQFSEQTVTNPNSYKSLTSQKVNECSVLFTSSKQDPTKFHSASPACQDYVIRANVGALADIVRKSYWFTEGFESYYMKRQAELLLIQSDCLKTKLQNSVHIPPSLSLYNSSEQEEKCKKVAQESNTLTCSGAKEEYLDQLTKFETALQKAYSFLEARIPVAQSHQDFQHVKHIMHKAIADNRTQTQQFVCQK